MIPSKTSEYQGLNTSALVDILAEVCEKIAPAWPLENMVAVNPYLGFSSKPFAKAAQEFDQIGNIKLTMPTDFYLDKMKGGQLKEEDLSAVLKDKGLEISVNEFLKNLKDQKDLNTPEKTMLSFAEIASRLTPKDWDRFMVNRISGWAAAYFDKGYAGWNASYTKQGIFQSWKLEALTDRTPEITGLRGFRKIVTELPDDYMDAIQSSLTQLRMANPIHLEMYFHRLLRMIGGWSGFMAYLDWENKLENKAQNNLFEFLAILICWDVALLQCLDQEHIYTIWETNAHAALQNLNNEIPQDLASELILQEAFDRAAQREIIELFNTPDTTSITKKSGLKAQAIFCIDVRSEVFRRNLEQVNPGIETLGFAGFFGFPIEYVPIGHNKAEPQCPVLIKPAYKVTEYVADDQQTAKWILSRQLRNQMSYLWKSFKSGAISSFSFVSPLGLSFLPKLISDSFGWTRPVADPKNKGLNKKILGHRDISLTPNATSGASGISVDDQVTLAKNALKAMSLTDNFAPFVLVVGHGSSSVNNPHATGLDCGACGGHSGEANAKVAASVLNSPAIREKLSEEGIAIPEETTFLACLHDTTTDEITIFHEESINAELRSGLQEIKDALMAAGKLTRSERAARLLGGIKDEADLKVKYRSKDWSQVRPEWGLAGCSAFIIADRKHTRNISLKGKSFLHSYNWLQDSEFAVLEQIMTAPMIVTSWINLQYYASAVDNEHFGAGNKALHNVTAGLGVLEGASGDLRQGLAWQSVHDGHNFQHDPVRLNVIIQAPIDAISKVLDKHDSVKDLCENEWITLFSLNDKGQVEYRYVKDIGWVQA